MDISDERRLLDNLEDADPSLAEQVKEKLYTMDTVLHIRDRDLQNILLDMNEKEIALLLKGQAPEIRERINLSLSSRRRLIVADEGDMMGLRPRSEADAAVREFLERLRVGEEAGTFVIIREEADLI
jgi:flagellar motor switch protein FliG